ncbi:hypothetical protein KP509_31G017500 [Ceratopteris richardii]|uniref:Uncharacterized protein n=1 Tax=Ceratopteris richardii TaxID=49495 RepID=A0A8T2QXM6_CERRI|nr:hypothetical protein KP509_31G017500 [Ceratopteris richardii]
MTRVLLFCVFLLLCPLLVSAFNSAKRFRMTQEPEFRRKKATCIEDIENGLWGWHCKSSPIIKENCALRCISTACYEKIYGDDPLEEGEIDYKRGREFLHCVRRLAKE